MSSSVSVEHRRTPRKQQPAGLFFSPQYVWRVSPHASAHIRSFSVSARVLAPCPCALLIWLVLRPSSSSQGGCRNMYPCSHGHMERLLRTERALLDPTVCLFWFSTVRRAYGHLAVQPWSGSLPLTPFPAALSNTVGVQSPGNRKRGSGSCPLSFGTALPPACLAGWCGGQPSSTVTKGPVSGRKRKRWSWWLGSRRLGSVGVDGRQGHCSPSGGEGRPCL